MSDSWVGPIVISRLSLRLRVPLRNGFPAFALTATKFQVGVAFPEASTVNET